VNHAVRPVFTTDEQASWSSVGDNEIVLYVPEKPRMKQIREALDQFYQQHPHKLDVTEEQLINISFLHDQLIRHIDAKVYVHAVEAGLQLQRWLDRKLELDRAIRQVTEDEKKVFKAAFLEEMKLPATYFEDLENKDDNDVDDDPITSMYRKHPVWGEKDKAVSKRYQAMFDQLLSQDDLDKMVFIGSCPGYIALAVFRRLVQIERIVGLNLDERKECEFLISINRAVDDIVEDDGTKTNS
jgi:hypothetical protein